MTRRLRDRPNTPLATLQGARQLARAFFSRMDAANVDLKSFSDDFYRSQCGGRLQPVLDVLSYLHHDTACWLEITTLLIPGLS